MTAEGVKKIQGYYVAFTATWEGPGRRDHAAALADLRDRQAAGVMVFGAIGTVSHATLRTEDLLAAFSAALEDLVQRNADAWCSDKGRKLRDRHMALIGEAREVDPNDENAGDLVADLFDALDTFAAPGCYFGATEGDASDFGFWQLEAEQ